MSRIGSCECNSETENEMIHAGPQNLTGADIISLCQSSLPPALRHTPTKLQRATEGSDNQVWFIDCDFVARVASDEESSVCQLRELPVRELARRHCVCVGLPDSIVPRCVASGRWGDRQLAFTYERRIYGPSLEIVHPTARTENDLVLLLSALKNVPLDSARRAGLENRGDIDGADLEELEQDAEAAWQRLVQKGQVQFDKEKDKHGSALSLPDLAAFTGAQKHRPVLIHADFKGEHILVDEATGSIVGVLDWTDAAIGDPATDISGLASSVGSGMAARVALRAGYPDFVIAKGIFVARCDGIANLDERLNGHDDDTSPTALLRLQLHRALQQF